MPAARTPLPLARNDQAPDVLFSSYSEDPMFGVQAQGYAASHSYWVSLSVPTQPSHGLSSRLIAPTGEIQVLATPTVSGIVVEWLDEDSPHGALAAVGVAFLLVVALNRALRQTGWYARDRAEPDLLQWLDLVSLGTVCDVVPLAGLNRAFVAQGIKVARHNANPGLG